MMEYTALNASVLVSSPWRVLSLVIVGPALFLLASSFWRYWVSPYASPLACIRGPRTKHWFFGFLTPAQAETLQLSPKLLEHCAEYGGVWYATFTNRRPTLVLGDLDGIHHVLNNAQTYVRAQAQMRLTRLVFGDGLVGVDGAQHKRQRKVVGPAFSSVAVEGMAPIFYQMAEKLVGRWEQRLAKKDEWPGEKMEINAYSEFEALSMDIIGLAGFKYDFKSLEGRRSELEAAFVDVTKSAATGSAYSALRSQFPVVGTLGHYLSSEQKQLDHHKANIHKISKRLVEDAKNRLQREHGRVDELFDDGGGDTRSRDILTLLVQSNLSADPKDRLDAEEIISMVPTFLSGGYDNNASVMSYALYALARSPQKQERLREELLAPPPGGEDWHHNLKALDRLPYLDALARETLRLHSSAHSIPRTCVRDDVIPLSKPIKLRDGTLTDRVRIGKDDDVVIPQKWMNVDPALWGPDADKFGPERWIQDPQHGCYDGGLPPGIAESKHSGWSRLMTFSIGPRNCIGYRMAVAEFKVGLAVLVSRFEFLSHEGMEDVYGEVQIVDRPRVRGKDGYCMPCWVKALV